MRRFVLILVLALASTACSVDRLPFVYKMDVPQGNVVTQEMVDGLRAGMSPAQVQYVMGSPMLIDPFRSGRWDYVQGMKPGGGKFHSQRVSVFFENERLVRVEGDYVPQDPALRGG